ncbi:MAG TPA: glycosyltransferase [Patescibacteria group bacterium]|nr:glycosyltransferase [Patescibacteria group bacterium]
MKTALVYDRVNKWGGAEHVLLALHEIFPDAPLYTSVYNEKNASWAKVFPEVLTSFLQKFPFAKNNHEFLAPLMPLAFESLDFSGFNLVISVTSEAAKGIKVKPGTIHLCYCLTPTRYLYSHQDEYFKDTVFKSLTKPIINYLKKWDFVAAQRPDAIIGISTEVKERIKKYYKRDSGIIFPPVSLKSKTINLKKGRYYLIVGRLVKYKKVDLAVEAFNKLGKPLIIVGTGREEKKLKRKAMKNIKFAGQVSEKELNEYYAGAKALIMPQEEDFGIVSLEAQLMGTPVIAYKKGGAIDTVIPEKTGVFFEEQKPESIIDAVKRFEKMRFVVDNLYTNARRFSKEVFKSKVLEQLHEINARI